MFGAAPLCGNPVAVVLDGGGLSDDDMATIARWTNLSETTFVLPPTDPGADYRVRILTPASELAFAGHPTLGTCHAWLAAGGTPAASDVVVQQSAAGLVRVRRGSARVRRPAIDPHRTRSRDRGRGGSRTWPRSGLRRAIRGARQRH